MHDAVDGRRRGHGVGEDVLPLGEDEVRGYAQGPALVAFAMRVKSTSDSSAPWGR